MISRAVRLAALLAAIFGLQAACDNVTDPELPAGAFRFAPPPLYEIWWRMTESCVGRTGSLASIEWYESPHRITIDGEPVSAYWSAGSNRIVLHSYVVRDPRVVRHEMVHALLRSKGHPREVFVENCGGFVTCGPSCKREGGPERSSDPSDQRVPASAITVTSTLDPPMPSTTGYHGYFGLIVRATNTRSFPVVVTLDGTSGVPPVSFSAALAGDWNTLYTTRMVDSSVVIFRAGETKQYVFDLFAGSTGGYGIVPPGRYTITGAYGGRSGSAHELTLLP